MMLGGQMSNEEAVEDFLAHFGVKGMKWGVRNEDKGAGVANAVATVNKEERKAASRETKAKQHEVAAQDHQKKIDKIKANPSKIGFIKDGQNDKVLKLKQKKEQELKDAKDIRDGKFTDRQKKVIVGASVVAGVMLAYGAYKFHDSGDMNRMMLKGKAFINGQPHAWKKNDALAQQMDVDGIFNNVVKPINPNFGAYGTKMNCRRCTFAYEMRRRGYDVAATYSNAGTGQTALGMENATNKNSNLPTRGLRMYAKLLQEAAESEDKGTPLPSWMATSPYGKNNIDLDAIIPGSKPAFDPNKSAFDRLFEGGGTPIGKGTAIFNALAKNPDGARGELGIEWASGGGHSIAWEIIGGKPVIFDNQSGVKYDDMDSITKLGNSISKAGFTRLDNVELNDDFLMRWLKDA